MMMDKAIEVDEGQPRRGPWRKSRQGRQDGNANAGGAVYGLGMIGAMVYFLQSAESTKDYALALPKAILWPALLVYKLLKSL